MILSALVEGSCVNATARMVGVSKITVLRLLADAGAFCADYHDLHVRRLLAARIEADEIWSFCGCKAATKVAGGRGHGDVWTWTAIDADSKLCISYLVADRSGAAARVFMGDLASRVDSRIQLTTDAHGAYPAAVYEAFADVDYVQLQKHYAADRVGAARYSPPRFTRPTNGFSKRIENHAAAVALHFWWYNFGRKHMTLKTTPAVAAGIASKPLTTLDLVRMIEDEERKLGGRLTDYLPASS